MYQGIHKLSVHVLQETKAWDRSCISGATEQKSLEGYSQDVGQAVRYRTAFLPLSLHHPLPLPRSHCLQGSSYV